MAYNPEAVWQVSGPGVVLVRLGFLCVVGVSEEHNEQESLYAAGSHWRLAPLPLPFVLSRRYFLDKPGKGWEWRRHCQGHPEPPRLSLVPSRRYLEGSE